jgi:hypothetical protein
MTNTRFELPLIDPEDVVIRVAELGTRPRLLTPARANAPQAAKAIGQMFEQRRFGQLAVIEIDWTNETKDQPDEFAKPVMFMTLSRHFPGKGWLNVQGRIDIDSVFGAGVLTRSLLEDLVNELGEKLSDTAKEN